MAAKYQIKRGAWAEPYGYQWALVDTTTPDPSKYGFRVVTTMRGKNPIAAPELLRKRQARLNTALVLD